VAFLSIHTMDGDPDDLLDRKRRHMDPVIERVAPGFGAIWSVTGRTDTGIVTANLWNSPDDAARFTQQPEVQQAQAASGVPMPTTFERFVDVDYTVYEQPH